MNTKNGVINMFEFKRKKENEKVKSLNTLLLKKALLYFVKEYLSGGFISGDLGYPEEVLFYLEELFIKDYDFITSNEGFLEKDIEGNLKDFMDNYFTEVLEKLIDHFEGMEIFLKFSSDKIYEEIMLSKKPTTLNFGEKANIIIEECRKKVSKIKEL